MFSMRSLQVLGMSALLVLGAAALDVAYAGNPDSKSGDACCSAEAKEAKKDGDACCSAEAKESCSTDTDAVKTADSGEAKECCKNKGDKEVKVAGMNLAPCDDEGEELIEVRPASWPRVGIMTAAGYFPVNTCCVTGETLDPTSPKLHTFTHEGRLIVLCCPGCEKRFVADPARFLTNLDVMIKEQQGALYPLTACPTTGEELGGMGEPVEIIRDNFLVKFCCAGCVKGFEADPASTLETLKAFFSETPTDSPNLAQAE